MPKSGIAACLAALVLVSGLAKLRTFDEPLERDLATYATIADGLLHGGTLYSEYWDHKPPAIHMAYALAILVAGPGETSIYILWLACTIVTTLGIYRAAAIEGHPEIGLCAAAFWTILAGDLRLQANQPNTWLAENYAVAKSFPDCTVYVRRNGRLWKRMASGQE